MSRKLPKPSFKWKKSVSLGSLHFTPNPKVVKSTKGVKPDEALRQLRAAVNSGVFSHGG